MNDDYIPLKSLKNQFGINKKGEIIRYSTGRIISPYIGIDDYQHVALFLDGIKYRKRVHRLMAEAFLNNCSVVDHINGIKSDNRLENLRAVSHSENIKKAYQEQRYSNPHKGRGIWVKIEDRETHEIVHCKSMREAERFSGIDRHRIKTFLENSHTNYTKYIFYYDE